MTVDYRQEGDVAVLTLQRPDAYNAVDGPLAVELVAALHRAGSEARAAVLTGAGRAFCSGADLRDLMADYESGGPALHNVIEERFNPISHALADCAVPTVAAINGAAAGAGMGLALGCDLRVMDETAYLMSAFINVALIPDSGTSWYLSQLVGTAKATEIAFSGRKVEAAEAAALGLVHRLAPAGGAFPVALQWAGELSDGPTEAYVATRRLLRYAAVSSFAEALAEEERVQGELGSRPAHLEGVRAFMEKRPPSFRSAGSQRSE